MWRVIGGLAAAGVAITLVMVIFHPFGSQRSVEAYCKTFYGYGKEIRDRGMAANRSQDPVRMLQTLASTPRDLYALFDRLQKVAPDEIEPDVATLRDAFKRQADSLGSDAGHPFAGLFQGLMMGLATAPAEQRVDDWTKRNCGDPSRWI
jgi:hypothetical protein